MKIKLFNYIRKFIAFLNGILRRPCQPRKALFSDKEIFCERSSFKVLSSSSVVLHIENTELDGYFFECRKHTNIKEYVKAFIDDYFSIFSDDYPEKNEDREFILNSLSKPQNFKKFISMGRKLYKLDSGCMNFLNTGNGTVIGLDTQNSDAGLIKRMQKFVGQYAWCQVNSYRTNKYVGKNNFQTLEANAALATFEIAKLLNIDYLIPETEYITLNIDNTVKLFGLFVKTAEGCSILPFNSDERKARITPALQYDLSNLNVLDVITHEQDHSPNNYNVIINNDGLVTGVRAFDNKGDGTFFLHNTLDFTTFKNCSSFVRNDGTINRPYLSSELYDSLKAVSAEDIRKYLKGILNPLQIMFCQKRIKTLRDTIEKTLNTRSDFSLLKSSDWSENTLNTELNGDYGKTYLQSFYSDVFLY